MSYILAFLKHLSKIFDNPFNRSVFFSILFLLVSLFLVLTSLGYVVFRNSYLSETRQTLDNLNNRILSDIEFVDGNWNIDKYLSDPLTPHPHGSSGFSRPLYIIDTEGFIIERNLPIKGYLDSSDFSRLTKYSISPSDFFYAGERWRILSRPIVIKDNIEGVIVVGAYEPGSNTLVVDSELVKIGENLSDSIYFENNDIHTTAVDIRNLKFNISFEIVSKYNKVLLNNGRIPSFIDKSYVYDILNASEKIIKDRVTDDVYLIRFTKYFDTNNNPKAVIAVGEQLTGLNRSLKKYLMSSVFLSILLTIPLSFIMFNQILGWIKTHDEIHKKGRSIPKRISFDKKNCILSTDEIKINIPYASNQYYLISSLFDHPKKRWEIDELIDRIGENHDTFNNRTLYDTSIALNKKVSFKLVIYNRKTYYLNPNLQSSIS